MSITARKRTPTAAVGDTEAGWLQLVESGMSPWEVARDAGVSLRRVQQGVADARRREPTQGSVDSSGRDPEYTPSFGAKNPTAVPVFGPRPWTRADLTPVRVDVASARRFVLPYSAEPPPRDTFRPAQLGEAPPESTPPCPHRGPLPHGSVFYCDRCKAYGRPWDKRLIIDERERPKREPKAKAEEKPEPAETRAEKAGKPTSGKMRRRKAKKAEMAQGAA